MSNFSTDEIQQRIDRVSRENGHGELSSAIFNAYYGINHRGTGSPIPTNADQHGLTFFTRPNLNLSYDNIKTERIFLPLLDKRSDKSIFRAIRLLLDKDAWDENPGTPVKSALIDNSNPFICLLTNSLLSMSGWQDVVLDTYTAKEGRARETWSMGDGKTRNFSAFSTSASFRNMIGDPITLLFFYWVNYISLVYEGRIVPKTYSIIENEIDYMTRVYRLVLDPTRTYVRKISACGAAFPTNSPMGASHNFSIDAPYNQENKDISINLQMIGIDYLDPILVHEFNTVVDMFTGGIKSNSNKYVKLAERDKDGKLIRGIDDLNILNHRGLPRIDPITYELEWYVEKSIYEEEVQKGTQLLSSPSVPRKQPVLLAQNPASQNPFDYESRYNSLTSQSINFPSDPAQIASVNASPDANTVNVENIA